MRAYHHFSLNRTRKHIVASLCIILLPLAGFALFSLTSGISFEVVMTDLIISTARLYIAFAFAVILAWIIVVVFVRGKIAGASLAFFDVMQSLPTFAILPLGIRILGESEVTIIGFLVITIIWPIIFSIVSSLKQAERSWKEAVEISRIRGIDYVRYYLLPLTLPGIITGSIIGLGDGWEALVATELIVGTKSGLGPFFKSFSDNSHMTLVGVLLFLLLIFVINKFIWLPLLEKSHSRLES